MNKKPSLRHHCDRETWLAEYRRCAADAPAEVAVDVADALLTALQAREGVPTVAQAIRRVLADETFNSRREMLDRIDAILEEFGESVR